MSDKANKQEYDTFLDKVHEGGKPAVVMFYTDDCPPCDAFKPVFDKFSETYSKEMNFFSFVLELNITSFFRINTKINKFT